MNRTRLSIIIPAYNAANYIEECISSILSQGISDLEIICIDDASTDGTAAILSHLSVSVPEVQYLRHDRNMGAPVARNLAIDTARGTYLQFVDADDELVTDSLSQLLEQAIALDCDAIKGTMLVKNSNGDIHEHHLNEKMEPGVHTFSGSPDLHHLYQYQTYLFKRDLIKRNDIRFNPNLRNFQDPVFMAYLLPLCESIAITGKPVYLRRIVENSIAHGSWRVENFISLISGITEAYDALYRQGHKDAADRMRQNLRQWWRKFRIMRATLSPDEVDKVIELTIEAVEHTGLRSTISELLPLRRFLFFWLIEHKKRSIAKMVLGKPKRF